MSFKFQIADSVKVVNSPSVSDPILIGKAGKIVWVSKSGNFYEVLLDDLDTEAKIFHEPELE